MKNWVFLAVIVNIALSFSPASAQITISQSNFLGSGAAFISHQVLSGAVFDVGSAGAEQQWSFGNYDWEVDQYTLILDPSETPYWEDFQNATRAIHADGSGSYLYERIVEDACYMLGVGSEEEVRVYDPAPVEMTLPVNYQSTWDMVISVTQELEPGMVMTLKDSGHVLVDGWGTVSTPFGEFNVLRLATHHYSETYLNDVLLVSSEFLSYAWVDQFAVAVVNVDSDIDVTDPNFDYGIIEMNEEAMPVGPQVGVLPRNLNLHQNYPNPFNSETRLPFQIAKAATVHLQVFDATGRIVRDENIFLPAGSHELSLNADTWASGNYFARIAAGGEQMTRRMTLIR